MYDVIIIGKGPAGLSAAIYLCRAGRKVLVIGKDNKIWNKDVKISNYFGIGQTSGKSLMENGEKQARSFGAEIVNDLVTKIEFNNEFIVHAKKEYKSKNILIATGTPIKKQEISNENDYVGKGVSYCVPCDGFFFKNKKVLVVGNTDFALSEANDLLNFTKNVTIVTNGKKPLFKTDKFKVEDYKIEKIIGKNKVEGVETNKGKIEIEGIFVASGDAGANDLSKMLGILIQDNKIKVNEDMKTNVPNVWAAGDCTKGLGQISTAVCKGAIAATSILKEGKK